MGWWDRRSEARGDQKKKLMKSIWKPGTNRTGAFLGASAITSRSRLVTISLESAMGLLLDGENQETLEHAST